MALSYYTERRLRGRLAAIQGLDNILSGKETISGGFDRKDIGQQRQYQRERLREECKALIEVCLPDGATVNDFESYVPADLAFDLYQANAVIVRDGSVS